MAEDLRLGILHATVACLGRFGIAKTTADDVAREAGVSRATIYRYFPDGKDELIATAIEQAVADFFTELAVAIDDATDIADLLERALLFAHRAVDEHAVLQRVSQTEPERLMPQLSHSAPLVRDAVRVYFEERLGRERLQPDVTVGEAADWLARMGLSFVLGDGGWDLTDPSSVRRLVRNELLIGILEEVPEPER